ncbi:MAG: Galactokinase [Ilumatobacteraceae bacterium]|nr:Galactokinase [Ilumatobacteraceae bacterium]
MSDGERVTAVGPGRVNLIGEHTDSSGGLVLPLAIDLATTISGTRGGDEVVLVSPDEAHPAVVALDVADPAIATPGWARYVAGVVAQVRPSEGFVGEVTTTLPIGAGLSSSAALEVALALALGFEGSVTELARVTQLAEQQASGVPCGIMDQLASAAGIAGRALLIDCHDLTITPIAVPDDVEIRVIHSGQARQLAGSAYAERTASVAAAEAELGPLRLIEDPGTADALDDEVLRRRARHVISENARVRAVAAALPAGDLAAVGEALVASHTSLRDDFEVSTPVLDALVDRLNATEGVIGARLTGAGFGGCVVALTRPGTLQEGWLVTPSPGARLL